MRAVLFPGQGSQYVGMGSDFYKEFDIVKKIFQKVDDSLNFSLSKLILNGPESDLRLTENTQPAIMTIGVSIYNVLNNLFRINFKKFLNISRTSFLHMCFLEGHAKYHISVVCVPNV